MAESKNDFKELAELLSAAQLEKLKIEIEDLRNKNGWEERLSRYIPLMTAVVAVAGLFLAILQFQGQQRSQQEKTITEQQKDRASRDLDRTLRVQSQIRTDTDQLLHFTNDPQQTLSRVSFLLDELSALTQQHVGESQEGSQIMSSSKDAVTRSLVKKIHYDCDFLKNPRDVYFATTVIDRWPDYAQYLSQSRRELDFILYKYVRAVRDLHDRNPSYFEKLAYDSSSGRYIVASEGLNEEHQFQHYGDIVIGFMKHLSIFQNSDLMKKHVQDFKVALRNPALTKQLFTEYLSNIDGAHSADNGSDRAEYSTRAYDGAVVLTPNSVRTPAAVKKIVLESGVRTFTISLRLPTENLYKSYRASVFSLDGERVWQQSGIATSRAREVTIQLNSGLVSTGDYVVAIDGERPTGELEILERYYFQVAKD